MSSTVSSQANSVTSTPLSSVPTSPVLAPKDIKQPLPTFHDAILNRRSVYALNKELPMSNTHLHDLINTIIPSLPSSFNAQSARIMPLTGTAHTAFWVRVSDALRTMLPADSFAETAVRLAGFDAAYGTVLFFEDPEPTRDLEQKFPTYAPNFKPWAIEANAMAQFALWTALEAEGAGANLQHYGNLVEREVKEAFGVPEEWELKAQLVFGGRAGEAREKTGRTAEEMVLWREK
jgi:uncharacterized protein